MRACFTAVLPAALLVLICTASSRADWPANRHDAARSATGDGISRIAKPRIAWRHYLGGSVAQNQVMAWDLDANGVDDFLYVSGGRLFAKTADDMLFWRTVPLNAVRIDALADFDGDGATEVLLSGDRLIHLIRLSDGTVTWSIPKDHIGTPGAVRVADFNADGVADIYVADLACGSPQSQGDAAEVWSFVSAPRRLFALERGRRDYVCGANDTLVDFDSDGTLEVVIQGTQYFYVYSGADGALISRSDSVGSIPYGLALTRVANVDADPAPELVAFVDTNYGPPISTRRVFMMDWDPGTRRLVRRWERSVDDVAVDIHAYGAGGVGDLGADGSVEVVTSFHRGATDTWATLVLDAATGLERAALPGGPFRGLVELSPTAGLEVITGDHQQGTRVYGWGPGGLALLFEAERFDAVVTRIEDAAAPSAAVNGLMSLDLDMTEPKELLGFSYGLDPNIPEAMLALSGSDGTPSATARVAVPPGAAPPVVIPTRNNAPGMPQVAAAYSDGFLWVLDDELEPTNVSSGDVPSSGMRIGGYYSGQQGLGRVPLGGDLDGDGASEVVVVDSRNAILALNVARASLTRAPAIQWEISGGRSPLMLDVEGDRRYELAYWTNTPRASALRLVHGNDASGIWQRSIGTFDISPLNDLMAGDLNGDDQLDIVYTLFSSAGGSLRLNVASGRNGAALWSADYEAVVADAGFGAGSLLDREGDGKLDVLAAPRDQLQWLSGATGAKGPYVPAGFADYGLLAPSGGSQATLVNSGSAFSVSSFSLELAPRWSTPSLEQGRSNGVVAQCSADKTLYVAGHFASSRVSAWSVADGQLDGELVLSDGAVSTVDEAMDLPGNRLGSLTLSTDLVGAGRPSVLVPSSDGYLYAIDPCTMQLDWALNLDAPVGEAILTDTDGDDEDEIVVTAADGYVYGIDRAAIAGPAYVYENGGNGPVSSAEADVDWLPTQDTLYANWAAVDGAISYQYAVLDATGMPITGDDLIDVGDVTSVTASGLPLKTGMLYMFAVYAVGADGLSLETLSDGVTVADDRCNACGEGTRCVDQMCVAGTGDDDTSNLCDEESSEPAAPQCAACGKGTCCEGDKCVAAGRQRTDGCSCSVAARDSSDLAPYLALLLVGLFVERRRRRAAAAVHMADCE